MNFNSFNTFGLWGVIETPEEKNEREQKEKQQQQQIAQGDNEQNEKLEQSNEIDLLVSSLGLSSLVTELVGDENKNKNDDDILKNKNQKLLEIDLESAEEEKLDWAAEINKQKLNEEKKDDDEEVENSQDPFIAPKQVQTANPLQLSIFKRRSLPLIEYLCQLHNCLFKELHVLFYNIEKRREIILHLQNDVQLRTTHLLASKNFVIRCNDFTVQPASTVPALGGYLGITVRGYYYVKHGFKLRHPYMPCIIEFGGGHHRSYYPLEVISVSLKNKQMKQC